VTKELAGDARAAAVIDITGTAANPGDPEDFGTIAAGGREDLNTLMVQLCTQVVELVWLWIL